MSMKVSIVVPVYNVAAYVVRCINSVIAQTYKNIECILVDDCGKDNSVQIIENFLMDYDGPIEIKLIHHEVNKGVATARNTGINASTGDLIFFLDSDDTITEDCIEKLIKLFEKYPDIDIAQGNAMSEDGQISSFGCHYIIDEYIKDKEEIYKHFLSLQTTVPWNRLVRKSLIIEHSIFFPDGKVYEDMFWIYFIAKYVRAAAFTNDSTYVYYTTEGSFMTMKTTAKQQILRYTSRLFEAAIYIDDIKRDKSSKYQRQYLAVNLLSCLTELNLLKSASHWLFFWKKIIGMSFGMISHVTLFRVVFLVTLFPPLCFFADRDSFRWRIQQKIISRV